MKLKTCLECEYGSEKEGKSFCEFESCFSHLTKCIQNKALEYFFKRHSLIEEKE